MKNTEEDNPRQIFVDWANSIYQSALNGKQRLKKSGNGKLSETDIDYASDYFGEIIGQCKAILSVLEKAR